MGFLARRRARRLAQTLGAELFAVIRLLIEQGHPIAEIRRRLADGIQRGDMISDQALSNAIAVDEKEAEWIASLKK